MDIFRPKINSNVFCFTKIYHLLFKQHNYNDWRGQKRTPAFEKAKIMEKIKVKIKIN